MSKKITIIPIEENSEHFFNIVPASEFIPEWYRNSPSRLPGSTTELYMSEPNLTTSTYKRCTPFLDALSAGYMVFLTADIEVTRKSDGMPYIMYRTSRQIITEHTLEQWSGLPCPKGYSPYVFKWHNQFGINISKGYSLLFISPMNRFDLPFISINGLVDCDNYSSPVQFPFFIKDDFEGIIEKGTPIVQIIPFKRDTWHREYEEYNPNLKDILGEKFISTIKRSYKKNHWTRKEFK